MADLYDIIEKISKFEKTADRGSEAGASISVSEVFSKKG